ncbi:MAG: SAM-dependent methyltransferase [Chloroflexi bacterium]|nr:SAM-dependent methyltransferase [Chloroflexota bacterium]
MMITFGVRGNQPQRDEPAVKEGKASLTAELTTAARAAESMRREGRRLCYDPLAREFLGGPLRMVARSPLLTRFVVWLVEKLAPGVPGEVLSRTQYIDDCLKARIDDGIEQLVILGAGYDSRPYRFEELKSRVTVFEVDHAATQEVKRRRVQRLLGHLPDGVVFVPIDFEKERLDAKLFASGYDRNLKTFFIWEGVSYYLTASAVDETLGFVVNNAGPGSSIVFDYAFEKVLEGASEGRQITRALIAWQRVAAPLTTAECFVFGIEEGTIEEFLLVRGFSHVVNINHDFFESAYFRGAKQGRDVSRICGFVHATVGPHSS